MGANIDLINSINEDIYRLKVKIDSPQDVTLIQSLYDDLKIRIQSLKTLNVNTSLIDITKDNNQVYTLNDKAIDRVTKSGVYFVSTTNNVTKLPVGLTTGLMTVNFLSETDMLFVIIDLDTLETFTSKGVYASNASTLVEWRSTSGSEGASGFSVETVNDMGTLSFTNISRTVTLNKNVSDIVYLENGREIAINTNLSKILDNVEGLHYVYLEDSVLKVSLNLDFNGIKNYYKKCAVCVIYWSVSQAKAIFVNDKRFSTELSAYLKWERNIEKDLFKYNNSISSAFDLTCTANSTGTLDTNLDISIVGGGYSVCGLIKEISNVLPATIPVIYTDATGKLMSTLNTKPFITTGSGRLAYNTSAGLVETPNDNFVIYTVILTTDINYPVKMLVGRNYYPSATKASLALTAELSDYEKTVLNNVDYMYLGSVIVKTSDIFVNTYKSDLVPVNGRPFVNLKGGLSGSSGGMGETDFYENNIVISSNYTITTGKNAMTAGPIEVGNGVTVEIPDGSTWTII